MSTPSASPSSRSRRPWSPSQSDHLIYKWIKMDGQSQGEVASLLNISQPTISHHLKILREAGLVTVSRRGVWAYYAANPHGLEIVRAVLGTLVPERRTATA